MKSNKEWFDTIADPTIRENAIENTPDFLLPLDSPDLQTAIATSFSWIHTDQGFYYWMKVHMSVTN